MSKVILFKNDNGGVSVIHPTPEGLERAGGNYTIIADKDVPYGKPYKILDKAELPADRELRNAWTIDESELTDGVGSISNEFS